MPINHLRKIIASLKNDSDWEKIAPSEHLKNCIEGFYIFSCNDIENKQLIFNDGLPAIVFLPAITDYAVIRTGDSSYTFRAAWVNGGIMRNVYVHDLDRVETILVLRFRPQAFYDLFNLHTDFFRNKNIASLADIHFAPSELDKIYSQEKMTDRIIQIESCMANRSFTTRNNALFDTALEYIRETKGQTTVSEVTGKIKVNYKWLERYFTACLGISPKEYIQLQRFIFAYINFTDSKSKDLTEIALASGFYDYNHFLKTFKSYTGKTPLTYASDR